MSEEWGTCPCDAIHTHPYMLIYAWGSSSEGPYCHFRSDTFYRFLNPTVIHGRRTTECCVCNHHGQLLAGWGSLSLDSHLCGQTLCSLSCHRSMGYACEILENLQMLSTLMPIWSFIHSPCSASEHDSCLTHTLMSWFTRHSNFWQCWDKLVIPRILSDWHIFINS